MGGGGIAFGGGDTKSKTRGGTTGGAKDRLFEVFDALTGSTQGVGGRPGAVPTAQSYTQLANMALQPDMRSAMSIPLISMAMDQSRRAGSRAKEEAGENLARTGLAGTPFGERVRADTAREAEFSTSQVPAQFLAGLLTSIPQYLAGFQQLAGSLPQVQYQKGDSKSKHFKGSYGGEGGGATTI